MISVLTCVLFALTCGLIIEVGSYTRRNLTCGIDSSKTSVLYEGVADIEDYPWLGTLFYLYGRKRMTISVVLVTKQIVIGSANEIDILPKEDFRYRSRVVLGHKCSGPSIKVRDYSFHPDYTRSSYSALAMVQLDVDVVQQELRPICAPPTYFVEPQFYAMAPGDCNRGKVKIYKMQYVPKESCKQFYRKSGLNIKKFWPTQTACARAVSRMRCNWRSGTALVMKQDGRWRLLGFGLHGPGCQAPARFLDYGMHQKWVRQNIARIGMPAITRLGDNHLIMRRSLGKLQRFGYCDHEEMKYEIYTDEVVLNGNKLASKATYNLTLYSNVEYSCVMIRAAALEESSEEMLSEEEATTQAPITSSTGLPQSGENNTDPEETTTKACKRRPQNPRVHLRRWCADPTGVCYGFQFIDISFFIEIDFKFSTVFSIAAYGKTAKIIDALKVMEFSNKEVRSPMYGINYKLVLGALRLRKNRDRAHRWFYKHDI